MRGNQAQHGSRSLYVSGFCPSFPLFSSVLAYTLTASLFLLLPAHGRLIVKVTEAMMSSVNSLEERSSFPVVHTVIPVSYSAEVLC